MCKTDRVFDGTIELADNAMLKIRPEFWDEWDFEKNDEIGLDIYKVSYGYSKKKVWWICPECKSSYDATINKRTSNRNCPYCSGKRVNHTNSLATLIPRLAAEWHPSKNGDLTPHDITVSSFKKVWWLGECGHEWELRVSDRTNSGQNCHYCSPNPKVLKGFNDMWTTNLKLASKLENSDDGYKYTQWSSKKVDWKCLDCGGTVNKAIYQVNRYGLSCKSCGDGKLYPEKFIYHFLKQLNINFIHDETTEWSNSRRYDFYISSKNMIIEVHGLQHYKETTRGRSLEEEQENDRQKYEMAMKNGIGLYIVIDARKSELEYIKNSLLTSDLNDIYNLDAIDWNDIEEKSNKSITVEVWELWNNGLKDIKSICDKVNLSYTGVRSYLKRGAKIGKCDYSAQKEREKSSWIKNRVTVQLDKNNCFVREWESMSLINKEIGANISCLSQVCNGKRKTAGGYKWMYKEDYEKSISSSNKKVS